MRIVHGDEVERRRGLEHRGGTFFSRTLVHGEPGTPGNFKLSISENGTDHKGPRHRHNFDQFRYMISGESDFARDGKLVDGVLGYFPEAVRYGPQTNRTPTFSIVLQFGGASGSGYLLPTEVKKATEELKQFGEFRDGVFHRNPDLPGKRNLDGFQAIWEHVHQREMKYPLPRYDSPVFMNTENYEWIETAQGVHEKLFGVFTERRTEASMLMLDSKADHQLVGRGVWVVLAGEGVTENTPLRRLSAVYMDKGETLQVAAKEMLHLLHYGLPNLPPGDTASISHREAAE